MNKMMASSDKPTGKLPLHAVLTLRERQEEAALQAYGIAARGVELARERVNTVVREMEAAAADFLQIIDAGCAARELARAEAWFARLRSRQTECERRLRTAELAAQEALSRWLAARQARQLLMQHLDRLAGQAARREQRKEQGVMDDLAATRRLWNMRRERAANRLAL